MTFQSALAVGDEVALFNLAAIIMQLIVLFQLLARHRREVAVGAEQRRPGVIIGDLLLLLWVNHRVRIDVGTLVVNILVLVLVFDVRDEVRLLAELGSAHAALELSHLGVDQLVTSQVTAGCRAVRTPVAGVRPT